MITIVKKGKIPDPAVYMGTCGYCSTEILANVNDCDFARTMEPEVTCPLCRRFISVIEVRPSK